MADKRKTEARKLEGEHVHTLVFGCSSQGHYRQDKRHGHGKYEWGDGSSYEGEFLDGEG